MKFGLFSASDLFIDKSAPVAALYCPVIFRNSLIDRVLIFDDSFNYTWSTSVQLQSIISYRFDLYL